MIDNQVQQINTLTSQLTEFKNYEAVFGNPAQGAAVNGRAIERRLAEP